MNMLSWIHFSGKARHSQEESKKDARICALEKPKDFKETEEDLLPIRFAHPNISFASPEHRLVNLLDSVPFWFLLVFCCGGKLALSKYLYNEGKRLETNTRA